MIVIIARQRHAGGEIKCFAETFHRTDSDELPELAAPTGCDGDKAPEQAAAENEVFAPKAVANVPRERCAAGIHPHERGTDKAQLNFVKTEFLLELREYGVNGLAIRVVEKANEP